jgi:hypothetical protein
LNLGGEIHSPGTYLSLSLGAPFGSSSLNDKIKVINQRLEFSLSNCLAFSPCDLDSRFQIIKLRLKLRLSLSLFPRFWLFLMGARRPGYNPELTLK